MNGIWVNTFPRLFYYKECRNEHPCTHIFRRDTLLQVNYCTEGSFKCWQVLSSHCLKTKSVYTLPKGIHSFLFTLRPSCIFTTLKFLSNNQQIISHCGISEYFFDFWPFIFLLNIPHSHLLSNLIMGCISSACGFCICSLFWVCFSLH